jgi:hypothetical protein
MGGEQRRRIWYADCKAAGGRSPSTERMTSDRCCVLGAIREERGIERVCDMRSLPLLCWMSGLAVTRHPRSPTGRHRGGGGGQMESQG